MKHCILEYQREGTCFHEFQKGKFDGKTFWKSNSLLLSDDKLMECMEFIEKICAVIPEYNPYDVTEVIPEQWKQIEKKMKNVQGLSKEVFWEIDKWAKKTFETYECFTIIGL